MDQNLADSYRTIHKRGQHIHDSNYWCAGSIPFPHTISYAHKVQGLTSPKFSNKCKIISIINNPHNHSFAKCTMFLLPWNTQKAEGISDSTFVWEILSGQNKNKLHKLHSYSKSWLLNEKLDTISNVHITLLVTLMCTSSHTVATMYCSLQMSSFTHSNFLFLNKRNIQPNCFNNPQDNP